MGNVVQLKYDELTTIGKQFNTEGDDYAELYSTTRQKVQALYKEWIGLGADKFFDEMEHDLLPALQRVSKALFYSEEVLGKISKLIHETDEENANYFKNTLGGGDDFGAAGFASAFNGGDRDFDDLIIQATGGGGAGGADFGASGFQSALGGEGGGGAGGADFGASGFEAAGEGVGGGAGSGGSDDFGAGQFEQAAPPASELVFEQSDFTEGVEVEKAAGDEQTPATEGQPAGGGGGGGGGGSSQGLQGDLKNMGLGLVDETNQSSSVGSATPPDLPDHLFSSGGSGGGEAPQPSAPTGGGAGGGEPAAGGEGGVAAGIAGVAGSAAVGAAVKAVKDAKEQGS